MNDAREPSDLTADKRTAHKISKTHVLNLIEACKLKSNRDIWLIVLGAMVGVGSAFTGHPFTAPGLPLAASACLMVAGGLTAWLVIIDLEKHRLPDLLNLALLLVGFGYVVSTSPDLFLHHVIGAAIGYGVFRLIGWWFHVRTSKEGLGLGDAKLAAALGAWHGWYSLPTICLIAAGSGLITALIIRQFGRASSDGTIAFGPFLLAGFWWVYFLGPIGGKPFI